MMAPKVLLVLQVLKGLPDLPVMTEHLALRALTELLVRQGLMALRV